METNSETIVKHGNTHLGSGIYFWSGFFVFILSVVILSIEGNILYVILISGILLVFSFYQKSRYFGVLSFIPCILYLSISQIYTQSQEYISIGNQIVQEKQEVFGKIQGITRVKNGTIKYTIQTFSGSIYQVQAPVERNIQYGDFIRFVPEKNEKITPFHISRGLDLVLTTSRVHHVKNTNKTLLENCKNHLIIWMKKSFPQPEQGLIAGILIGDPSLMDDDTHILFRQIGLSHITVVSGSNISFLISSILLVLFFLPKKLKVSIAIGIIILYILLVGGDPPVLRAGIMGIIGALGLLFSGKFDSFRILALTCLLLLIPSPLSLVYDAGFQLSFLATLGILIVGKIFPDSNQWRQAILISIFACLWTLPITIGSFGNFHTWSIVANIFAGPLIGISMTLSIIGGILDTIWETGSYWITFGSYICLHGILSIAGFFGPLPYYIDFPDAYKLPIGFISFGIISGLTYRYQYLQKQ